MEGELKLRDRFGRVAEKATALLESMPEGSVPVYHRRIIPMAKAIQQGIEARLNMDRDMVERKESEGGKTMMDGGRAGEEGVVGEGLDMLGGNNGSADLGDFGFLEQFLNGDDDMWLQRLLAADEFQAGPGMEL